MTSSVPPEVLAPAERKARIQQLRDQIAREWVRHAITEGLLGLLLIGGVVLWRTGEISDTTSLVLLAVSGVLVVASILFTMKLRMGPWRKELERLERLEEVGGDRA